jgi:hypothetical protein
MAREPGSVELHILFGQASNTTKCVAFRVAAFSLHTISALGHAYSARVRTGRFEPLALSPVLVGIGSQRARNFSTSSSDKRVPM